MVNHARYWRMRNVSIGLQLDDWEVDVFETRHVIIFLVLVNSSLSPASLSGIQLYYHFNTKLEFLISPSRRFQ
ncbi:hypothetical protein BDZ45DRAFT_460171 [Acephala macrosclerotiorum]|nr:hypothetical protein BDZ45DRAFT_460171 [Acephala macrosclerotiorum]